MIALGVVVIDEGLDLLLQFPGCLPNDEVDAVLAGTRVAFNFPVGLGGIGGSQDVTQSLALLSVSVKSSVVSSGSSPVMEALRIQGTMKYLIVPYISQCDGVQWFR